MRTKLQNIGVQTIADLMKATGGKRRNCFDVWHGKRPLSKKMALKLKHKTGASLDYLLG